MIVRNSIASAYSQPNIEANLLSGYTDQVSGVGVSKIIPITFPTKGTNFIEFAYTKDRSGSSGDDCGKYRIVTDALQLWWSQAKFSGDTMIETWSVPIRLSGVGGKPGADGTDVEFIYTRTSDDTAPTSPETTQTDDNIPNGWTDDPQGVGSANPYEWVSVRYKTKGVWGEYSPPSIWAKWGADGKYTTQVYCAAQSKPAKPTAGTDLIPNGWYAQPPTSGDGDVIWITLSVVEKNAAGEWVAVDWSDPVQWSGKDGQPGNDGRTFSYVGDYVSGNPYTGDSKIAQVVRVNTGTASAPSYQWFYTNANVGTGEFPHPTSATGEQYWTSYGANFESVATNVLYAKDGTLGSFAFNYATKEFRSADGEGIIMNSETGEATLVTNDYTLPIGQPAMCLSYGEQVVMTVDAYPDVTVDHPYGDVPQTVFVPSGVVIVEAGGTVTTNSKSVAGLWDSIMLVGVGLNVLIVRWSAKRQG